MYVRDYGKAGTLQITMELHAVGSSSQFVDGLLQIRILGRTNYFYKREPLTDKLPKRCQFNGHLGMSTSIFREPVRDYLLHIH